MKSLNLNLIFAILILPFAANAGGSEMYKHYLKLANEKYPYVEVDKEYDKARLDEIEKGLKKKEDKIKALFTWMKNEKRGGNTNLDEDFKDFGQEQAVIPVTSNSPAQSATLAIPSSIPAKSIKVAKQNPSLFSQLLAKLSKEKPQTLMGISTVEKTRIGGTPGDWCPDRSKDEHLRRRLKMSALTEMSNANHGKMLRPSDADEKRELNQFANMVFRMTCGRAPTLTKQVKKKVDVKPVVISGEPSTTVTITSNPTALAVPENTIVEIDLPVKATQPVEIKENACNLETAVRYFHKGHDSVEAVQSTLVWLYDESRQRQMNDDVEVNLRLVIFYYLMNNQTPVVFDRGSEPVLDPYSPPKFLNNIANCAKEEAVKAGNKPPKEEHIKFYDRYPRKSY